MKIRKDAVTRECTEEQFESKFKPLGYKALVMKKKSKKDEEIPEQDEQAQE